jgi:hypothetical protein
VVHSQNNEKFHKKQASDIWSETRYQLTNEWMKRSWNMRNQATVFWSDNTQPTLTSLAVGGEWHSDHLCSIKGTELAYTPAKYKHSIAYYYPTGDNHTYTYISSIVPIDLTCGMRPVFSNLRQLFLPEGCHNSLAWNGRVEARPGKGW